MKNRSRALKILLVTIFFIGLFLVLRTYDSPPHLIPAKFGEVSLRVEIADSDRERKQGLAGLSSIPELYGMLFVFDKPDKYGFWMNGMLVPIDIFWINEKLEVVFIQKDIYPESYPEIFYPTSPAQYVLETRAGFSEQFGIATGTVLTLQNTITVSE